MAVTVLLVDDVEELRGVMRQALKLHGGFDVVAEAGDGAAAVAAAGRHQPDVVVLDLGLPDVVGAEVVARLHEVAPDAQVVVYTGSVTADSTDIVQRVAAFVRKEHDVGYLVDLLSDLDRDRHRTASVDLGPDLADVAKARRFVAEHCMRWGCSDVVEDAQLVVTELVTNALVHAGTPCELRVRFAGGVLRFEIEDGGGGAPDVLAADESSEHGRGLLLVSALCMAWGLDTGDSGRKVVWAELLVSKGASGHGGAGGEESMSGGGARTGALP